MTLSFLEPTMKSCFALLMALLLAAPAAGHFVYIVPDSSGQEVQVVFSEVPLPDEKVAADKIAGTEVFALDAAGRPTRLATQKHDHFLSAKLPSSQTMIVTGVTQYGVANS